MNQKRLIQTKSLKKSYTTKAGTINVLKGIDFIAYTGEIIAITGASGVGKSTFLHIVGTLENPTDGEILYEIDGKEISPFKLLSNQISEFRNKYIGFVFQFHYLLPEFNVLENVLMPELINREFDKKFKDYRMLKDRAMDLLKELNIHERAFHRPGELSGGEQQRVAVARALLRNPLVVLADEPTGNLDSKSAEDLFELFQKINEKTQTTFIIVTHNETLAKKCTKRYKMIDGFLLNFS